MSVYSSIVTCCTVVGHIGFLCQTEHALFVIPAHRRHHIATETVAPSQILRKLASYPRQNELATALREVSSVERTLFMIDWILDAELQRHAQIGLNKGEAHHALKRAIIIFWNTMKLGEVVANGKREGKLLLPDQLAHVSPLSSAHINLTGIYSWDVEQQMLDGFRELRFPGRILRAA